ncbi:MAG: alpha/beta hydrolase [Candidatus Krumholzibacteria bacterium]|nr:alpha/beta hydrolase [Candidatus Krumholzibacteria bacterium]
MKLIIAAVLAALLVWSGCGSCEKEPEVSQTEAPAAEPSAPPAALDTTGVLGAGGRLVDVGGYRLHIRSFGSGSPTVVIEPGIGDEGRVWGHVVDMLAEERRVILYSRAGYGMSDPGPAPRSADREAAELASLLRNAEVDPPYVVVGHSLGALNALAYASQHKNVVAGLVLLDPPPADFMRGKRFADLYEIAGQMTEGFRRDAVRAREAGDTRQAAFQEAMASEHEMMFRSGWALVGSIQSLGDMPLVVVGSGVPNPQFGASAAEFQVFWRESSERLSRLSTRGRFVFAAGSTHDIPGDAPETVVEAVRSVVAESQRRFQRVPSPADK